MRNGESVWFCSRISADNAETNEYASAKELVLRPQNIFNTTSITIQPKNGYTDRMAYGETTNSDLRAILCPYEQWHNVFKKGDVFYVDGAKPSEDEEYNGQDANYYVEFVSNQNEAIELSLKQIIEQ